MISEYIDLDHRMSFDSKWTFKYQISKYIDLNGKSDYMVNEFTCKN